MMDWRIGLKEQEQDSGREESHTTGLPGFSEVTRPFRGSVFGGIFEVCSSERPGAQLSPNERLLLQALPKQLRDGGPAMKS